MQYNGKADDGEPDLLGLPGIHIECKRAERLNIYDAVDQAKRDARPGEIPVVFHRKNNREWLTTSTLEHFIKVYQDGKKEE